MIVCKILGLNLKTYYFVLILSVCKHLELEVSIRVRNIILMLSSCWCLNGLYLI